MDKKKIIIISIVVLLFLGIAILLYSSFSKPTVIEKPVTYNFSLIGGNTIQISQYESYNDMFVNATDSLGNDLTKYVSVNNNVDSTKFGKYTVEYTLKVDSYENTLTRYVIVTEKKNDEYTFSLNGDETVYLLKGNKYNEEGCTVYYNGTVYSNDVLIINDIDINVPGTYKVSYSYNINGEIKTIYRNVIVYSVNYNFVKTNNDGFVSISFSTDSEYYDHVVAYDGTTSKEKNYNYKITQNGTYKFNIYDRFGNYVTETVDVDIIYNDVKCNGEVNRKGTTITVSGADRNHVSKYSWTIDGKSVNDDYNYTAIYKKVNNASVEVTFTSGTTKKLSCAITNKLIYEFKYDEFNTKPFMTCKTYTAEDKTRLEDLLKRAINEAGYGTRAGVVEAARFLVGALDYKVPYLGPKNEDFSLGRYQKIGLNIGTKSSWGCVVSGWEQGMDCTNFLRWAFYQSGDDNPKLKSSTNTYQLRDKVSSIQVGDLLLSPNGPPNYDFNHVGMIIGLDSKYIYVAESTTGKINAVIVSKLDKGNLPSSGKFSVVKLYKYPSEGNVTDMWVS